MIIRKKLKIAVVGLGYVGLPLAVEFAKKGFSVLGIDVDKDRIAWISQKKSYITDVPTSDLREIIKNGKFRAESGFSSLKNIDAILICVPTPLKRKNHPNISFIKSAVKGISEHFKKDCLVILESTTYPGTTEEVILPLLEVHGRKHGKDFYLCFSPERIDPGNLKYPVNKIPKVIGGVTLKATRLGALVYGSIVKQVVPVSSPRVAETVKLLENTFRLINIGLIDEMAMMANKMNIDIWEVVDAAKTKPFGFMPFYPGPGVGGHCIPKDPLYLYWKAKKFGFKSSFIKLASGVIRHMPVYVVGRVKEILNQKGVKLNQAKILVIGATYKKDIKDLRQSPPLDIIEILKKEAGSVAYYDPLIPYLQFKDINLKSVDLKSGKLNGFDCAIIATDHTNVDYGMILENSRVIFDSRNVYKGIENKKIHRL
ncbi:MAG: nucleotide sugar dehydrogenase [Candidatus Omnitrophica bacterium]|nr:nucleotide sugar dehydrogenase [Candidatus Omnitrophota bacterium]MBU1928411.1 nucleotide sugar dehydrogenase [Candidatus Omnitrophota bacterium]MBU2034293.1 nucleotide sugar dehydrogenase [Candidatus Omnitrophota bacterium]